MENTFSSLSIAEWETLLKVPALVTLLAASYNGELNDAEKEDAVKLAHLRTFTSEPELHHYYSEVEKVFKEQVAQFVSKYHPLNARNRALILDEIGRANEILEHTDREFAKMFKHSIKTYEEHVLRSRNNVVEYFLFPFDLRELKL